MSSYDDHQLLCLETYHLTTRPSRGNTKGFIKPTSCDGTNEMEKWGSSSLQEIDNMPQKGFVFGGWKSRRKTDNKVFEEEEDVTLIKDDGDTFMRFDRNGTTWDQPYIFDGGNAEACLKSLDQVEKV